MIWLYRLQQRLSITRHEGLAVLMLTALFLVGITVRHIQEQQVPPLAVDSLVARPSAAPVPPGSTTTEVPSPSASTPININTAPPEALKALPGIGPALSKRIVAYRSTQHPFRRIDELKRVSGIGPKTLATLRPMVRVDSSDATPD